MKTKTNMAKKLTSLAMALMMLLTLMPAGLFAANVGAWANEFSVTMPDKAVEISFLASSINSHSQIERVFWASNTDGSRTGTIYMYVSCADGKNPNMREARHLNDVPMTGFHAYKNTTGNVSRGGSNSVFSAPDILRPFTNSSKYSLYLFVFENVTLQANNNINVYIGPGGGHNLEGGGTTNLIFTNVYKVEYYKDSFAIANKIGEVAGEPYDEGTAITDTIVSADLGANWRDRYLSSVPGYSFDSAQGIGLIISSSASDNVIKVLYTQAFFDYEVRYYKDTLDETNYINRVIGNDLLGSAIPASLTQFAPNGYATPGTRSGATVVTEIATNNVVKVLYVENDAITINYVADTGGSVSLANETLRPVTGVAQGSTATAAVGYAFTNWTDEDGKVVSTSATYVPAKVGGLNVAATYTAHFTENANVTINYIANEGGSVSRLSESLAPATGVAQGSVATAAAGYTFVNW
ncbi:MAG: hypothetical protein FWG28_03775, partial [Clostridiales bacterium]|nr:hypothetical protein [Clostridiales bacterium]